MAKAFSSFFYHILNKLIMKILIRYNKNYECIIRRNVVKTLIMSGKSATQLNNPQEKVSFFNLCVYVFVFGCFIGYIVEILMVMINKGHFVNKQGMIYGPFNQVYGFGALIFTICLYKFRNSNKYILFIISSLVGGTFEYVCSYSQAVIFKSESWNYSRFPLSFNGRTNPLHAMFWGFLGLIFISLVIPQLIRAINRIPDKWVNVIAWCLLIFMLLNMLISASAVLRQIERNKGEEPDNSVDEFLDKHYDDDYLKKIYPNMKFIK